MKKNFIVFAALMVTAFFGMTEIAKAADITIGGQFWTRYEINEHGNPTPGSNNDFNDNTSPSDGIGQRTAVDINAKINDETSAFIQLQSNRQWASGGAGDFAGVGEANSSFTVNDNDNSVGIHEAYFVLKNFATLPVDAKIGRQEVIIDGHRLFGDTLWTMGQQSHDGVRLDHKHDNMSLTYAFLQASEGGLSIGVEGNNEVDSDEIENHLVRFGYQGLLGGNLSVIYNYIDAQCDLVGGTACTNATAADDQLHTIGFRQAGQLFGIDYRGEYYYQWGSANGTARNVTVGANGDANAGTGRLPTAGVDVDREAYMFGVRVGKTFNNVTMKPGITFWYDYLSGTSDDDLDGANPTWKSFNTLFDTGHKFYGLQDLFLGIGTGVAAGGTSGLGLQDLAIKLKLSPMPKWTAKIDYHWFYTAEGVAGNPQAGLAGSGNTTSLNSNASPTTDGRSNALGNELDVTLINKYNANTSIMIGFSNYTTTAAFRDLRTVVGDGANWAYLQFMVDF